MKRMLCAMMAVVVLAFMLVGCNVNSNEVANVFDKEKINESVLQGNTEFAFDIFSELNKEDKGKNVFISPLSISTALSMTYQGANGETKDDIKRALKYSGIDMDVLNDSYENLLIYLNQLDDKVELDINNSIWIREGEEINDDFKSVNREIFNADIEELDFSKEGAEDIINKWVSDSTKGKIEKIIDSSISSDVIMYLINAIYFKGQWQKQFNENNTYSAKFNAVDGKKEDVMMMSREGDVEYTHGENYKAVRLPYGEGKISMYCILPDEEISMDDSIKEMYCILADEETSIDNFIKEMNIDMWKEIRENVSSTENVMLKIPRFKMEYGIKNLNDSLSELGMGKVFDEYADFSGIRDDIYINRVLHKAVIEVNEEGSEAAAVTAVEINETCAVLEEPKTFIADRPFVFIIADDDTGSILFMGKLCTVK